MFESKPRKYQERLGKNFVREGVAGPVNYAMLTFPQNGEGRLNRRDPLLEAR